MKSKSLMISRRNSIQQAEESISGPDSISDQNMKETKIDFTLNCKTHNLEDRELSPQQKASLKVQHDIMYRKQKNLAMKSGNFDAMRMTL